MLKTSKVKNHFAAFFFLISLTFCALQPSLDNGFVNWDDPAYIQGNPQITNLEARNIKNIFTSYVNSNYQPLSVLSLAIEYHFVQLNPWLYHFDNVFLHIINTLLVYLFCFALTKNHLSAFLTGLLFGIHPTRVESAAWVTERKDVLFALFYLLGLLSYLRARTIIKRSFGPYLLTFILFILSLLAKPTAITFPLVLMFIDYYEEKKFKIKNTLRLIPFFLISFLFGIVTIFGTFIPDADIYPVFDAFLLRINGQHTVYPSPFNLIDHILLVSYAVSNYIGKIFWTVGLSPYYPYPPKVDGLFPLTIYLYPLFLLIISKVSYTLRRSHSLLFFSLCFFLSGILLNLPFRYVGHISIMGDRFTYIAYIGPFLIIADLLSKSLQRLNNFKKKILLTSLICLITISFIYQSRNLSRIWKNSGILWSYVALLNPNDPLPYFNRGNYYFDQGDFKKAVIDYTIAMKKGGYLYKASINRAISLYQFGHHTKAIEDLSRAIKIRPKSIQALLTRALNYIHIEKYDNALADCRAILDIEPQNGEALRYIQFIEGKL